MDNWFLDVRFAFRRLRKRPAYTLLAALTLALGVGGTAAIFSLVRGVLLEPLPYAGERELVTFWHQASWSEAEFRYLENDFPGFREVGAWRSEDLTVQTADGSLRLVPGIAASANLFEVLGVSPLLGSGWSEGDDREGSESVAILSHGLWQELGGDRSLVGRAIRLDGVDRKVGGVMPAGFWFPDPTIRVWMTTPLDPENRSGRYTFVGRLDRGASVEAMGQPLSEIARRLSERFDYVPEWDPTRAPSLTPLRETVLGPVRPALLATLVAMGAILLIGCANVAALMLGQLEGRSVELAVRSALGARMVRLIRQMIAEALLIGALAAVAGAAIAVGGFRLLVMALPLGALAEAARIDWTLFAAGTVIALLAALAVVLVPSLSLWRSAPGSTLAAGRTGGVAGRGGRLEQALVVGQVALAVIMAAGAALLVRSVANLRSIDPGVGTRGIAVIDGAFPQTIEPPQRRQILTEVLGELGSLPGVRSAAAVQRLPLRGGGDNWGITIEGEPEREQSTTAYRIVTVDYFRTMGIELREGRVFEGSDRREETEHVVVVNEALAKTYFPGRSPVGSRVGTGFGWARVIGVVENVAEETLLDAPLPARYVLADQISYTPESQVVVIAVEREGTIAATLDLARRTIQRVAPDLAIQDTTTMRHVFDRAVGPARQVMSLLTILGGLALAMGAIGVYGVVSHFVTRRRRDWGIRMALGLPPGRVVAAVLGRGTVLVTVGIVIGIALFLAGARALASFLHGVTAADPLALAASSAALLAAGAAAAILPARRAGRIDPARVLRDD